MHKSASFFVVAALSCDAGYAEESPTESEAPTFTGNIALTNNYKFRGQDQGKNRPAIQGGFDYVPNGFYVGNWNSSVNFDPSSSVEMDFYIGHKGKLYQDLAYDVGALQYYYPQHGKSVNYNTTELYAAIGLGPASLKYSHTVSADYFGWGKSFHNAVPAVDPRGRNTGYLDFSASMPLADRLLLSGHVGYTHYAKDLRDQGLPSYFDYKFGVTYELSAGFSLAAAVVGANKRSYYGAINKTRAVVMLSKAL